MGRFLEYPSAGATCRSYYAAPEGGQIRAGVLVVPEAPGVGEHVQRRVDALAAQGYAALAVDLYGQGRLAANPDEARSWVGALKADPSLLLARLEDSLAALRDHAGEGVPLSVAGYCFGGWCALELARSGAPVRSVAVFHGSVASERGAAGLAGRSVLVCTGDADPFVPASQLAAFADEMREAGIDSTVCLYSGVGHGFTDVNTPAMPGFAYSATADRRSWQSFLHLLADHSIDTEPK
ncbi:hypothetical protein WSK_3082 [Novosphingobium sp. Rr 2-17]|uniref:dienelactone hydrolase family protein n=1 Tax=Novosphingobium sp. Rr 2-17 TaxID=555793 RepID=UPI0002697BA5|nr:dienelactone hydrolase family protein [Novosphingobium sp. Rr 2-17]EIZ78337.1 hypothetical protein WSK_3082 [Novosphingobium sp. Rr 2-17]